MKSTTKKESCKHFIQFVELYLPNLERVKVVFDEVTTFLCVDDLESWRVIPDDSVFSLSDEVMHDLYDINGSPVSPFVKDKLSECQWCSLRRVAYALDLDDYNAIVYARNAYVVSRSTWDGSCTVRLSKAKFDLKLYDDFGVSTRNITDYGLDISPRIYLGLQHIMKYWPMDVLKDVLNIKVTEGNGGKKWKQYDEWVGDAKSQAVSFALAPRVSEYLSRLEKHLRDLRRDSSVIKRTIAEACFMMVPRSDPHLPEGWREIVHPKCPNVTFFPYHTLKAIGLPAIPKLEDAINNRICGLQQ